MSRSVGLTRPTLSPHPRRSISATSRYVNWRQAVPKCIFTYFTQVDEKINDAYFAKSGAKGKQSAEDEFFAEGKPKAKEAYPESRAADQKAVDGAVIAAVKKTEYLSKYLRSSFGLSKGQFPHQLVF